MVKKILFAALALLMAGALALPSGAANVSQFSTSAASNNSASPDGFPEGMAPSGVNDSARELMAALAKWYSDTDGSLTSGGSSNAYTLTTNSSHAALADQSLLVFRANHANTAASTLNVDTLGAKAIQANGHALAGGEIASGAMVAVSYDPTDDIYELVGALSAVSQAEAEAGTATTPRAWTAQRVNQAAVAALSGVALPLGYKYGLTLSNNATDAINDIDIAVGSARGADDDENIVLSSAITKRLDATWSAGTGNGGLSSSLSAPANNTWYHVHAIVVGGVADVGFDTSVTAANLIADHSATAYRRIGSVRTGGSANLFSFIQDGDTFLWGSPSLDSSTAATATAALVSLLVPPDVKVEANINVEANLGAATFSLYVSSPDSPDSAPSGSSAPLASMIIAAGGASSVQGSQNMHVRTNTSGQVRQRANTTLSGTHIVTLGWRDRF